MGTNNTAVKFKKQFSRLSTGATTSNTKGTMSMQDQQQALDRLKSIEKIHEERQQLVGLKSPSMSKKNEQMNDAFDVELKVNNEFELDAVDQLRSINSVSMNQGQANMNHLNQSPSLMANNNQYQFLMNNQQYSQNRQGSRNSGTS